uniref:Uncharacterized protein n=1 Tax=Magallana gigas TaxID=29159 RepID=K1PF55_MAGGI
MLSTAFLFHAEEEIMKMSLRALNTVEAVEEWAEKNGLINHPLVVEKLKRRVAKSNAVIRDSDTRLGRRVCCTTGACPTVVFAAMSGLSETAEKREKSTEERGKGIKCKKCGHVSANKREHNAHRKFHAEEEKPQREKSTGPTCRICSKEFPNRMALYIHQNVDHQTGSGEVGDFP